MEHPVHIHQNWQRILFFALASVWPKENFFWNTVTIRNGCNRNFGFKWTLGRNCHFRHKCTFSAENGCLFHNFGSNLGKLVVPWISKPSLTEWHSTILAETSFFRPKTAVSAVWPKLANNAKTVSAVILPKIMTVILAENCFGHTLALALSVALK